MGQRLYLEHGTAENTGVWCTLAPAREVGERVPQWERKLRRAGTAAHSSRQHSAPKMGGVTGRKVPHCALPSAVVMAQRSYPGGRSGP